MSKRRGDVVCRALAGSLLAAGEADTSTVSVYNSPIYGASSFVRRGNGKQSHMVGIQNFTHSRLRLLVWDDHAKAGWWFFSWDGGFVCSGREAKAPVEWVDDILNGTSIDLSGDEVRWSKGLEKDIVEKGEFTDSGWLKLELGEVTVGLTGAALAKTGNEPFVPSIALAMMPPKISAITEAEWMWRPAGWPAGRPVGRPAGQAVGRPAGWSAGCMAGRQSGRPAKKYVRWPGAPPGNFWQVAQYPQKRIFGRPPGTQKCERGCNFLIF